MSLGVLNASLPEGFQPVPGSLQIEHLTQPASGQGGAFHWRLKARRSLQAQLTEAQAIQMLLGVAPSEAQKRLAAGLSLDSPARIILTPSWWPRLPVVPFRITVINQGIGA
jgi:hypothetical protein